MAPRDRGDAVSCLGGAIGEKTDWARTKIFKKGLDTTVPLCYRCNVQVALAFGTGKDEAVKASLATDFGSDKMSVKTENWVLLPVSLEEAGEAAPHDQTRCPENCKIFGLPSLNFLPVGN